MRSRLRTLSHFVEIDPMGVFRRIDELLQSGERWGLTADSLTEGHAMPKGLASAGRPPRPVLADAETRGHVVSALSAFSRAGFPSARRILYGLDDMFADGIIDVATRITRCRFQDHAVSPRPWHQDHPEVARQGVASRCPNLARNARLVRGRGRPMTPQASAWVPSTPPVGWPARTGDSYSGSAYTVATALGRRADRRPPADPRCRRGRGDS